MSLELVDASAFGREDYPERIFGFETETDIRFKGMYDREWPQKILNADVAMRAGLEMYGNYGGAWFGNGAHIYNDVDHMEYCTPESLGALEATAALHAGILVMNWLVEASGIDYLVYRRSATVRPSTGEIYTKGHHLNFCIPNYIANVRSLMPLETHLATQFYAHGGIITKEGFNIAPKSYGIGTSITESLATRVKPGEKPFGIVRPPGGSDFDTTNMEDRFGRFEDRTKTPGSRWSDFMGLAPTSLLLRLIEHPFLIPENKAIQNMRLKNSVAAFRAMGKDLTFSELHELDDGRRFSTIDIQEHNALVVKDAFERGRLNLKKEEIYGLNEWLQICNDARAVKDDRDDLDTLANRMPSIAKYTMLAEKFGEEAVNVGSREALNACMVWDRIVKPSAGQMYDRKYGIQVVDQEEVERLTEEPPQETRAKIRGALVVNSVTDGPELNNLRWPYAHIKAIEPFKIDFHPYQTRLNQAA